MGLAAYGVVLCLGTAESRPVTHTPFFVNIHSKRVRWAPILKTYEASRQRPEICKPEGCTWGIVFATVATEFTNGLVFGGEGGREEDGGNAASRLRLW